MSSRSIYTDAIHAGERLGHPDYLPVTTPVYTSVSYTYDTMEDLDAVFAGTKDGYVYGRYGNPTTTAFETAIAALEQAEDAVAYATGMAAIHGAVLGSGAQQGSSILCAADVYGATYALHERLLSTLGIKTTFVDITDLGEVERLAQALKPSAILCEAISNPLIRLADVPALAAIAHAVGAALVIDCSFATPFLIRPLTLGADYVVHSATKYIGGHGDVMAGVVACSAQRAHDLRERQKLIGANLSAQDAWLALRGIKTLPLRMERHCANASQVAAFLAQHPAVAKVNYPGLGAHPQHDLATSLFEGRGYGAMISFEIAGADQAQVFRFMEVLKLVVPATTLGDIHSLVLYPAHSSHRAVPPAVRQKLGISDGLVRLSVGIEDAQDIIADLDQALTS